MRQTPIDAWMIAGCALASLGAFAVAIPEHVVDASWPEHARNHVLQALFWIAGLNAVQIMVALGPYRRGRRYAWSALLVAGVASYGGYFLPILVTGGGAPGALDDLYFGAFAALYVVALVVGWRRTAAPLRPR